MSQPAPLRRSLSSQRETLSQLRQLPGLRAALAAPLPAGRLPFALHEPGLPLGALTHLGGARRTSALLALLAEHPELRAAWVEERVTAYPPALARQGLRLERLLFVQAPPQHYFWALTQVVRSQLFKVVVAASPMRGEGIPLRQLQLACEQAACALIVVGEVEGPAWPVRLWLESEIFEGHVSLRAGRKPLLAEGDDARAIA
jgi:hypothetical protein